MQLDENILSKDEYPKALKGKSHFKDEALNYHLERSRRSLVRSQFQLDAMIAFARHGETDHLNEKFRIQIGDELHPRQRCRGVEFA